MGTAGAEEGGNSAATPVHLEATAKAAHSYICSEGEIQFQGPLRKLFLIYSASLAGGYGEDERATRAASWSGEAQRAASRSRRLI